MTKFFNDWVMQFGSGLQQMTFFNWLGLIGSYVLLTIVFSIIWHHLGVRWRLLTPHMSTAEPSQFAQRLFTFNLNHRKKKREQWSSTIWPNPWDDRVLHKYILTDGETDYEKIRKWSFFSYFAVFAMNFKMQFLAISGLV